RFAHQEFLRALSGLVVVVVLAVVGGAEVIVVLGLAADRQRRKAHFVGAVAIGVFGVEHIERVAGLHLALEVHVVGVDADHLVDHRLWNVVAQRRLVQALIERGAALGYVGVLAVALGGGLGIDIMNVDRHVIAGVGQRCRGFDRRVVFDNDAQRQDTAEARWRQKDAQPLSFLERAVGLRTEY